MLCDVPCSGDGTLRKNPDIWDSWQPRASASMFPLQLAILTRGLQLLRPGGYLVYSTCSLSPIENEAVLAAALGCSSSARLGEQASRTPAITGCAHGPSPRLRGDQRSCRCAPPPLALVGRLAASRGDGLARSRLVAELADDGRLPLPRPRHRDASRAATRASRNNY